MRITDLEGNEIQEGDRVAIKVGDELTVAPVVKIDSGLSSNLDTQGGIKPSQPVLFVQVIVGVQAMPDGRVMGIYKVGKPLVN